MRSGTAHGSSPSPRGEHFVRSLERGLTVIRAFSPQAPSMTLSEVARATGLTRAAARRFLLTLVDLGYVRTDGRRFALTPRVLELGRAYLSSAGLPGVAPPHLERLAAEVHGPVSVSVLDGDDVVCVAVAPPPRGTAAVDVGARFPAHATSAGRVLLSGRPPAELEDYLARVEPRRSAPRAVDSADRLHAAVERAADRGWAIVDEEPEEDLRSVSVPVRDRRGEVVAAVSVSAHAPRASVEDVRHALLPPMLATAARIGADLEAVARSAAPFPS